MKKRIILVLIISILLISICLLTYKLLYKNEIKEVNIEKLNLKLVDKLQAEFLSDVKVSDFIDSSNYRLENDYKIKTDKLGNTEVSIILIDNNNAKYETSFNIEIIDVTPPLIWLDNTYTVSLGSEINLLNEVIVVDNYDVSVIREIIGSYDLYSEGTYPLTYKATDQSGNTSSKDFNLIVTSYSNNDYYYEPTYTYFSDVVNKYKSENTQIGLDLSAFQGEVDFKKLKESGVEFVIIRVGSEDNNGYFIDKRFEEYYEGAKDNGILVGVYFYSYANSEKYAINDANLVLKHIKDKEIDLPVVFDWEEWKDFNDYHFSLYSLYKTSDAFFNVFRDKGYNVMLYGSYIYLKNFYIYKDTPIWLAHYTNNFEMTPYDEDFEYWQIASDGIVDGIDGYVDIDIRYLKNTE